MDINVPILKIEMQVTEETYQRIRHVTYPSDLPRETSVFNKEFLMNLLVLIERRQDDPNSDVEVGSAIIDVTDWKDSLGDTVKRYGITVDNWLTVYQVDPRKPIFTVIMDFSQMDTELAIQRYLAVNAIVYREFQVLNEKNMTSVEHAMKLQEMSHRTPIIRMSPKEIEANNTEMRDFLLRWIQEPEHDALDYVHELRDLMVRNFGGQVVEGMSDDASVYDLANRLRELGIIPEEEDE